MKSILNSFKLFLLEKPKTSILILSLLFLVPSFSLYFVSEDLNFALRYNSLDFPTILKNIWFPTSQFVDQRGLFRPIFFTINIIDYKLWGLNSFGYHFTNALFHLLNILLIYSFALQIFQRKQIAIGCSLLFLFHPIIANSVYWISGRTDIISCSFYLISLILINKFLVKNHLIFLIFSSISFLAALLSKEIAITLPLVHIWQVIYWKYILNRYIDLKKSISIILIFDFFIVLLFLFYRFLVFGSNLFQIEGIYHIDSFYHLLINIVKIFSFLVIPSGHEYFELFVYQYKLYLIFIIVTLVFGITYLLIKKKVFGKTEFFILILILVTVLPLLKLTMRWYMYIPTIPFAMLIVYVVNSVWNRSKLIKLFILLYFVSIGYGSLVQYRTWLTNSKINNKLVTQLVRMIYKEKNSNLFIIVNFPAKVHRTATFVAGFEELIQLHLKDKSKSVIRLVNVIHQYGMEPIKVDINAEKLELAVISGNSYFLLGTYRQIFGIDNLTSGDSISLDIGNMQIEEVNQSGRAVKIAFEYGDKLLSLEPMFLYFDEDSLTYKKLN